MKAVFLRGCALLAAASLAGCSSMGGRETSGGGTDVTSFHLGQPIARGQISVEAFDPADVNSPEFGAYSAAVQSQLTRLGWTLAPAGARSEQVALIDVQQGSRAALTGRVGGGAGLGAGASGSVATMLEVRISRRSDGTVIWEGRSIGQAPADAARASAVESLAAALFRGFPGESGRTIRAR